MSIEKVNDPTQLHFLGKLWGNCHYNVKLVYNKFELYIHMCTSVDFATTTKLEKGMEETSLASEFYI